MPAYNAAQYIRATIDSVLSQTEQDFELLIINDGSTDDTEKIVREYDSPKIVYHTNPQNLGIAKTYNRAIKLARGKYLAIAESDDISHPQRFEVQARYLDEHLNIGAVSARTKNFSSTPPPLATTFGKKAPVTPTPDVIRSRILRFWPAILHPVAMLRAEVLRRHGIAYNDSYSVAFDVDLFLQFAQVTDLASLECDLLGYRKHENNHSAVNELLAGKESTQVVAQFLNHSTRTKINPEWFDGVHQINSINHFHAINCALEEFISAKTHDPHYDNKTMRKRAAMFLYGLLIDLAKKRTPPREIYAAYRRAKLLRHVNLERKLRLLTKTLKRNKNR